LFSRKIWTILSVLAAIAFAIIAYFYVTTGDSNHRFDAPIPATTPPPRQQPITQLTPEAPQDLTPSGAPQTTLKQDETSKLTPQTPPVMPVVPLDAPLQSSRQSQGPLPTTTAPPPKPQAPVAIIQPNAPPPAVPLAPPTSAPQVAIAKTEAPAPTLLPEPKVAATQNNKKQSTQVTIPLPGRKADR
jgi:hypothetical protein